MARLFVIILLVSLGSASAGADCFIDELNRKLLNESTAPETKYFNFLAELEDAIRSTNGDHTLDIKDGLGYVKIGRFHRNQGGFSKALLKALKAGAIAEVNAGQVVGPKVLALLWRMKQVLPNSGKQVRFSGLIRMAGVEKNMENQLTGIDVFSTAEIWNKQEIEDYKSAIRKLGVKNACRKIYNATLKSCGYLRFSFSSGDSDPVTWEQP